MRRSTHGFSSLALLIIIAIVIAAAVGGWAWYRATQDSQELSISSFEECEAAGYPVGESHPRQCFSPDGRSFTEEVENGAPEGVAEFTSPKGEVVRVKSPLSNQSVNSPLTISGEVRGSWSFEADFPVELRDSNNRKVAEGFATLDGDWMTEDYVPFQAVLEFSQPSADEGKLILRKSNPSGERRHDDAVEIPVKFSADSI